MYRQRESIVSAGMMWLMARATGVGPTLDSGSSPFPTSDNDQPRQEGASSFDFGCILMREI